MVAGDVHGGHFDVHRGHIQAAPTDVIDYCLAYGFLARIAAMTAGQR